jgi:hypothetical protein
MGLTLHASIKVAGSVGEIGGLNLSEKDGLYSLRSSTSSGCLTSAKYGEMRNRTSTHNSITGEVQLPSVPQP